MDGVLNIDKPAGMTSHDVVYKIRRLLNEKKVGHTGTLDPDATGVLPVCLGKATKIIQFLQDDEKGYEGAMVLGIATDTLDASGKIVDVRDSSHVKLDDINRVFGEFVGEQDQIPPMVSAIKVQGQRLYKLAREGKTVDRAARRIHIYALELLDFRTTTRDIGSPDMESPARCVELDFRVRCSKGTYIRSLAADVGDALGCGGHLSKLVRIKSGIFQLEDSVKLEEIQAEPQKACEMMRSMNDVLSDIPTIVITDSARERFLNGVAVSRADVALYDSEFQADDVIRVQDKARTLLGLGKAASAQDKTDDPRAIICKAVRVLRRT